jgi:hypothetical protein
LDTLPDGVYHYNGWAHQKLIRSVSLPFVEATGIWIKKTPNNSTDNSNRTDVVINNDNGKVYVMKNYNGTWRQAYLSKGGGTVTGDITIETPSWPALKIVASGDKNVGYLEGSYSTTGSLTLWNQNDAEDTSKRRGIRLLNSDVQPSVAASLVLSDYTGGDNPRSYAIYGEHNKPTAADIGAGTLGGRVRANATHTASVSDSQIRNINAGTIDLTAGSSELETGALYFVYE